MGIVNFLIYFTIIIYVIGLVIYGFYDRTAREMASLESFREYFEKLFSFLDYLGMIPMYFGQFIAVILIKINDFINWVMNFFTKSKK